MTVIVKHNKTNTITDWTQAQLDEQIALGNFPSGTTLANIVLPSDWNNDHTLTGLGTMAEQDATAVAITGGTINNTTIGATTATTGVFTTVGVQTSVNANGASSNINLDLISKGTGNVRLITNGVGAIDFFTNNSLLQSRFSHTASAVNYVQVTGAATGNAAGPLITAQGSDASVPLSLQSKLNSPINFFTSGGFQQFRVNNLVNAVNYPQVQGSVAGNAVPLSAIGSDTNISMAFQPKGTGAIDLAAGSRGVNISNGGTVTAITRTATGSAYTSAPTATVSAPTTAGGVQATATSLMGINVIGIVSGGTGYTVGNTLTLVGGTGTVATLTVSTVSSGAITAVTVGSFGSYSVVPTNPISVTGGSGSGATFTSTWAVGTVSVATAGSGYIEQPTIIFSGGGGSGAAAYATVGSNTTIKNLGNITTFATPNSNVLAIVDKNAAGNNPTNTNVAFAMVPQQSAFGASYLGFGSQAYLGTSNATSAAFIFATSVSSPVSNGGGGSTQLQLAHTSGAVNHVQVTGAATGANPAITVQGSDATRGLAFSAKGNANINFFNNNLSNNIFVISGNAGTIANYLQATASVAGTATSLQAQGSDTNIDLSLTPKGTGLVRFGTYVAGALLATGYINIKAADGTTYKVLVST